jgi:hypothetical protein
MLMKSFPTQIRWVGAVQGAVFGLRTIVFKRRQSSRRLFSDSTSGSAYDSANDSNEKG